MILRTYWYGFLTDIFRFGSWFRFWWRWRRWSCRLGFWFFILFLLPVIFFRLNWLNFRFDNLNDSSFFPRFWWFRVWFRLYFSVSSNNFNFGFRIFLFSFAIWSPIWIFSSPWRFVLFRRTVYSRIWSVLFWGSMSYSYDYSKVDGLVKWSRSCFCGSTSGRDNLLVFDLFFISVPVPCGVEMVRVIPGPLS